MVHDGGCLCGAVRFRCLGEPINVRVCHCRLCQKAFGAPFNARALFPHERIRVDGPLARHPSSPELDRLFCEVCGTRLMSWRASPGVAGVALACFDDRNAFAPSAHIWVSEKVDWLALADGLPQFDQGPPG